MPSALTRYRIMAWVTGVFLASSCLFGLSFWPWALSEDRAAILWTFHGWFYIVYVITTFWLGYLRRWRPLKWILVALAGTVPFMSFVAERRVVKDDRAEGHTEGMSAARAL